MLAEFVEDFRHGAALLFGVVGARSLVADPESVNPHFQDFLDFVLTDGLDAGEGEDGNLLAAGNHAIAELHRALFIEEKVLVQDKEHEAWVHGDIAFDHGVNVLSFREELDVFAPKIVRRAAEIAAVGAAQAGENLARA